MSSEKEIKHILVAEDNEATHHLLRLAFHTASFEGQVDIVENGEETLSFLKREGKFSNAPVPDLILLDLNMPGKNGVQILGEIKGDKNLEKISLVVLTGSNAAADIKACSKYHCQYLLKPSRFHELVKLIQSLPQFV